MAQVPAARLIAPAVVLDFAAEVAATPTSCSRSTTSRPGRRSTARCPTAAGCSTAPAGTRASHSQQALPQRRRDRPAHPGPLGRVRPLAGRGVAGDRPRRRDRRHRRRRGALASTRRSRATRCCSAPASTGSPSCRTSPGCPPPARWSSPGRCRSCGAPAAPRGCWRSSSGDGRRATVAEAVGRTLVEPGVAARRSASSAAATSTSPTRWSRPAPGSSRPGTRAARRRWPTPTRG